MISLYIFHSATKLLKKIRICNIFSVKSCQLEVVSCQISVVRGDTEGHKVKINILFEYA